jgi:hypothetical protein
MARKILYKTVDEVISHRHRFTPDLNGSTTLTGVLATAVDSAAVAAPSVVGTPVIDSQSIVVPMQGGVDGEDYSVTLRATTDDSQVLEHVVELRVRDSGEERHGS